jgi:hypothetical protein
MTAPIEALSFAEARTANEIPVRQVVIRGDTIGWDWVLRSLSRRQPLGVSAYQSTSAEPRQTLEAAIGFTLHKVGLKLAGGPFDEDAADSLVSLRYRVAPDQR